MHEIKAPENSLAASFETSLFAAGGITNCPDWQAEFVAKLSDTNLIIYNPRRDEFDVRDPSVSSEQIEWEYQRLKRADLVSFWFCKETLCPITLFELGAAPNRGLAKILIGIESGYQREFDIREQVRLLAPKPAVPFFDNLDDMALWLSGYAAA